MSEFLSIKNRKVELDLNKDPHGWIQWKGTDVCIDIHCKCGYLSHYDGDFMYFIQCPKCKRIYESNGNIQLIERNKDELKDCSVKVASGDNNG